MYRSDNLVEDTWVAFLTQPVYDLGQLLASLCYLFHPFVNLAHLDWKVFGAGAVSLQGLLIYLEVLWCDQSPGPPHPWERSVSPTSGLYF